MQGLQKGLAEWKGVPRLCQGKKRTEGGPRGEGAARKEPHLE